MTNAEKEDAFNRAFRRILLLAITIFGTVALTVKFTNRYWRDQAVERGYAERVEGVWQWK